MSDPAFDFATRLRMTVAVLGKQTEAARRIGISQARLSNYIRGVNAPPPQVLRALATQAGVRLAWLTTGRGPVFPGERGEDPGRPNLEDLDTGHLIDLLRRRVEADPGLGRFLCDALGGRPASPAAAAPQVSGDPTPARDGRTPPRSTPPIRRDPGMPRWPEAEVLHARDVPRLRDDRRGEFVPLVAGASAGLAFEWEEEAFPPRTADRYVRAPGYKAGTFAMQVLGTSMEPRIAEGCIVLFGEPAKPSRREGRAALAIYEDAEGALQYTLKYVSAKKGRVRLRPANDELFPTEEIPPDRLHRLYPVIGVLRPAPSRG